MVFTLKEAKPSLDHCRCHACRRLPDAKLNGQFSLKQKLLYVFFSSSIFTICLGEEATPNV